MAATYRFLDLSELRDPDQPRQIFALDVLMGLSARPKRLPSRYFYDDEGSRIFQRITELPEYYLTGAEREIFERHGGEIARGLSSEPFDLVELGPGDGRKTRILLQSFQKAGLDFRYVPIDISESAISGLARSLEAGFPGLEVCGLVSEYFSALQWLNRERRRRTLVLFSGSNIGNFSRPESLVFLRSLWNSLNDDDLVLIGFDLKKDVDVMLRAYNDSRGVTRDFSLNLLRRINRELGGDFDLERFRFFSTYDVLMGSMNSYLLSLNRQTVSISFIGQAFAFEPWEPIQTEYSYKYLESDICGLAAETGFEAAAWYFDSRRFFTSSLWRVRKRVG
ncbi:MAG: L-histidine N(alpha)-methyltransferase [Acidobacteriota bacterium]